MTRRFLNLLIVLISIAIILVLFPTLPARVKAQQVMRFLGPPYYGTTSVNSVFDHEFPINNDGNNWTMHYDGTRDGPGARSSYDEHRGIDYGLRYELVRAAAPGIVARADWANPANHRASYGLHIRIDHDIDHDGQNDYRTIYGHMSVLQVQQGEEIHANANEFQRIIGRSGNTGNSWTFDGVDWRQCGDNDPPTCGAHLHFQLEQRFTQNNQDEWRPVNPYGWIGNFADPWSQHADGATSVDRWISYPSITNGDVFTSGAPLVAPPMGMDEPGYFIVDDGDADFDETAGCWTVDNTAGWNDDYRRRNIPNGNCTATWNFAQTRMAGRYNVFVHIPNDNVAPGNRRATVDAVRYAIRHTPISSQPWNKQTQIVVVNQWAYPNNAHASRWVYLGAYYFNTNQYGTDYVRLESDTLDSRAGVMAADAVLFAPVRYRIYLPLVTRRWPPIPNVPVLNPISNPGNAPNYTVSWQAAYLASTYTLQEATNANFSGAVTRYSGAGTLWTATNKPVGTYYYRVRARNSWGDSGWSNVQSTTVLPPAGWQIITSQDFEGAFPGEWIVGDNNGPDYGEYYWGRRTCRPYAGSYSGWGVGGGAQGAALSCGSNYPHHADSWMVCGPFSLAGVARAELQFKLWLYTELENDYVFYSASVDDEHFHGYAISGNTQGWTDKSLDLANVPALGNLLGRPQVWVVVGFYSNGSVSYAEGGYVDDVVLRQCYRECPSGSSAAVSGSEQIREVPIAVTRQSGRILAAPVVAPQPSASPLSVAEPFRSPLPITQP